MENQNKVMGPWAYVGLGILYSIPLIGFIFLVIFSFGKNHKNRRNFTRSYWCKLLVVLVLLAAAFVTIKYTKVGDKMEPYMSVALEGVPSDQAQAIADFLGIELETFEPEFMEPEFMEPEFMKPEKTDEAAEESVSPEKTEEAIVIAEESAENEKTEAKPAA